jgi:BASS family bile acid:Na+ symporter
MVDFAQLIKLALSASILLLVIGLGMRASLAEATSFFRHLFRPPYSLIRAIIAMNFVVPIVAATVAAAFALYPPVKIALVAVSISPVPPILPSKQVRFGGRASYVYGLLVAVSLAAIVFVPLSVELLGRLFHRDVHMSFAEMAKLMGKTILLPLGAGMTIRQLAPGPAVRIAPWVVRIGNLLLIIVLVPLLIASLQGMWFLIGNGTILAMGVVIALAITAGQRIGGPDEHDRTALGIVSAMRHPGVALAIGRMNFPDDKLLPAAILLYTLVAAIVTTVYGKFRLRQLSRSATAATAARAGP